MERDTYFMSIAIELAYKFKGLTHPNPTVGAVIVKNGEVIGKGFHKGAGKPHAEIEAINDALKRGYSLKGTTIYVTLEPCCHYGRTPPCTDAIVKHGFKRVVVSTLDPNPLVSGKGIEFLRSKGIEVVTGVLEAEAKKLNEDFFVFIKEKRPFVHLKIAQTIDGKIATFTGDSKWITSEPSRKYAHKLRKEAGAVLVGVGTAINDNPELTVRHIKTEKQPVRVLIDKKLKTPISYKIFNEKSKTVVITSDEADKEKLVKLKEKNVELKLLPTVNGKFQVKDILDVLYSIGVVQVLVEGGSKTVTEFIKSGYVDRLSVFIAPKLIGDRGLSSISELNIQKVSESIHLTIEDIRIFQDDIYVSYRPVK